MLERRHIDFIVGAGAVLVVLGLWQYHQSQLVTVHYLDNAGHECQIDMPRKDRHRLERFVYQLFAWGNFGYVILGTKPLAWEMFRYLWPLTTWRDWEMALYDSSTDLRRGWKTWEKYKHLFPDSNMWIEHEEGHPNYSSIFIVNESNLERVFQACKKDFDVVLGGHIETGAQLLSEAKHQSWFAGVLQEHQALMGIVLGYGPDNSWMFWKSCNERRPAGWAWTEDKYHEESLKRDPSIPTFYYDLSRVSCPSFAGDPHSAESLALQEEYLATKRLLLRYYKDKDPLSASLSLLAGFRPK